MRKKIKSFGELEDGWDFGTGRASPPEVINKAVEIYNLSETYGIEANAFPGTDGEIMFAIYPESHYLEFTFELDDSVTFYREKDDQEICYQEGLSFEDAKTKIGEFEHKVGDWQHGQENS